MTDVTCYGVEYFNADGSACPHTECVARQECKSICETAQGILHDREVRIKSNEVKQKNIKKEYIKKDKDKIRSTIFKIQKGVERKSGYARPQRLEYKNEGCLRDEMMECIKIFFKESPYTVKTTRYIQSVSDNFKGPVATKYLLKISTTRKKSILVYIDDQLSDKLDPKLFVCRQVYEYEKLCFPNYLEWVVKIESLPKLDTFLSYLEI